MDTSVSGVEDKSTANHSPNNVHVCVSIAHIQPQQRSDVIRRRGRTHIPGDDVHPVTKGCYLRPVKSAGVQHTSASEPNQTQDRCVQNRRDGDCSQNQVQLMLDPEVHLCRIWRLRLLKRYQNKMKRHILIWSGSGSASVYSVNKCRASLIAPCGDVQRHGRRDTQTVGTRLKSSTA